MRLLLAVTFALLMSTTAAEADAPACGDVLTHSVTLRADLACAPDQTALTIGANDIVIDLGGHAITGANLAIDGRGGFDGVIVRGGELRDNELGIRFAGVDDSRVAHLEISGGFEGVSATGGTGLRIRDVDSCANFNPIVLSDETGDVVRGSRVCGSEIGMTVAGSSDMTVAESTFEDNTRVGLRLSNTDDSVVRYNRATGNRRVGFSIANGSSGNRLVENEAKHNASGIEVLAGATDNRLRGNIASVNDVPPGLPPFTSNGFDIFEPTTWLADNVANRNPGIGINAPSGAVDGGGNRARNNGVADCVNVAC